MVMSALKQETFSAVRKNLIFVYPITDKLVKLTCVKENLTNCAERYAVQCEPINNPEAFGNQRLLAILCFYYTIMQ